MLVLKMLYQNEVIIGPFRGASTSEASGRDSLAIQNNSVVIYTKMMTGTTDVTNRIRYNGFYCWFLKNIFSNF